MSAPTVFKGREIEMTEQELASAVDSGYKAEVDEDLDLVKSDIAAAGGTMPSNDPGVKRKRGRPSKKAALDTKKLKRSTSADAATDFIQTVENPSQPAKSEGDVSQYDTPRATPESPTLRKVPVVSKSVRPASNRSSTRTGPVSNGAERPYDSTVDSDTDDDTVDESEEQRKMSRQLIQTPKKRGRPRKSQTSLPSSKAVAGKPKGEQRRTSARQSVLLANRQQEADTPRVTRASTMTDNQDRKTPTTHGRGVARVKKATKKPNNGRNRTFSQEEYQVERIVDSMIDADTKEHLYMVKWKGYPSKDNTWEPKSNLKKCENLLKDYDAKKGKSKK